MNKSNRKNIVSTIITLLILAAAALIFSKLAAQKKSTVSGAIVKKERRSVKTQTFTAEDAVNNVTLDGRLKAHDRVMITSKVQGTMQKGARSLREGMYFKEGDLLFSIDSKEANFGVKAQKANLMSAITKMMPDLKFDHSESFAQWQTYLDNFDMNGSLATLPQAVNAQEKYFVAGRNIYSQYYNIKGQETRLADYNIYTPFSGIITAVNVVPGALISPGQQLASMINTSTYEIEAPIPYASLSYITTGQKVNLSSTDGESTWTGRVSRIGSQIDAATQNVPVFISVSGRGLKDGMYLKGNLAGKSMKAVTVLPKDILVTPTSIYVVQDSTIVSKQITPIKRTENQVFVRGLAANDRVIYSSLAGLFVGQKVNY